MRFNVSVPLVLNIYGNSKSLTLGVSLGNAFEFSVDNKKKYYFFVTPLEFTFIPAVWHLYPQRSLDSDFRMYYTFNLGLRMRI